MKSTLRETKQNSLTELFTILNLGLTAAIIIICFCALGYYVDLKAKTTFFLPSLTCLGVLTAGVQFWKSIQKILKNQKNEELK